MFRLEKLEISGFKSFADRTSLVFGEGITGVVGPNGCGKSNIAEAISWVLGEQSAKNLRGGKMEDVIFNGTRDRKPTGLSEVTLTLVAIEDIAARDSDDGPKDAENEYEDVVEKAEHAAETARALVQEITREGERPEPEPSARVGSDQTASLTAEPDAEQAQAGEHGQAASPALPESQPGPVDRNRAKTARRRKAVAVSAGERITVGRRLYRTGDSDYLMNGRPCLLRDIQDLFAGTGLGGSHYAIIEQGRIGQILSSKPLDRRALIEEAAGITKFKTRKRSAELKLESAKQNLARLNDIISEIERQVNSLKRQAQKARRYRRLREEMRNLQKLTFTADYYRLNAAVERVAGDLESAEVNQRKLDARLVEQEAEYRSVSAEARAAEDGLSSLREQAAAIELEADRARNRRAFEEQQIKELSARIEEIERDQHALTERLSVLESEIERRAADLKSLETEVSFEQIDLFNREGEYQAELARLREAEGEIEQLRQRVVTEIGQTERLRNASASLEDTLRRVVLKQTNLHSEMERAEARQSEASSEYARVGSEVEDNRAKLSDLTSRISERSTRLFTLREQASDFRSRLSAIHGERTAAEHRLLSLEEVDAHRSYYSDAVQQVLSVEHSALINGLGTLADFVEVEAQYERLIESLFGRELQCVLVPTIDDALAGVEHIKVSGLGRGAFLVVGLHGGEGEPSDFLVESSGGETEMISIDHQLPPARSLDADAETELYSENRSFAEEIFDEKILDENLNEEREEARVFREAGFDETLAVSYDDASGRVETHLSEDRARREQFDREATVSAGRFQLDVLRAIDLLRLRPEIKTVVERAFPEKCAASVVPDIEAALQLSIENASRVYVTYEGEQVVNGRLIVTGAQAGQKGTSLLGLKREIKELRVKTAELRVEEAQLSEQLDAAQQQFEEVEGEASSLDLELRQQEKAVAARDSQLEGLARDLERARQHVRVVEAELEQTADERVELEARILQLGEELRASEASRDIVQQSLSSAQAAFLEMRGKVEQMSESLSIARASVAARVERLQAARSEMRRIENESEELRGRINRNRLELYEGHGRAEQLTASRAEAETAAARFEAERAGLAEEISIAGEAMASARARTDELEKMLTELRQEASAAHERRGQIEVERARIESEAEHLTRSCFSELAMSLEDVVTSVELGQAARHLSPGDEPGSDEARSNEAAPAEAELQTGDWQSAVDIDAAKARLDELRVKLDEMGPVNMMALEELEESEQRFTFLSEQRRDILDSIKLTEEGLAEIKRRSRERFRHAFTHVNRNFQQMFVELFGGGRGEMILIDEEDVLESGIDLIAQPPGKRLQNVLLLSGGEKAMAAIALVLAIFQYRPSPFCILDEVDAPLDEMNVGRFSNKVIEMSAGTQFLVITHNKRTMEAARALYGVTMEEPGVSKLVSVKFE